MTTSSDTAIGAAIRAVRKRLGWDQAELARRSGLEHAQTVSRIEKGKQPLKVAQLARLAEVLRIPANELLSGRVPPRDPFVLWREPQECSERQEDEAGFLERCRRYALVEEILGASEEIRLRQLPLDIGRSRYEDMESWAEQTRDDLGLGEVPAASLRETLENGWGVKLFRARLRAGSAATTRGEFGDAIVESLGQSPGRRSFNLGYELFHLMTWDAVRGGGDIDEQSAVRNEQLANVFASALLMPEGAVRRAVSRKRPDPTRFIDLVPVARAFSVSLPALLWRMVSLGMLGADDVREFLDPAARWGSTDPGWVAEAEDLPELPERYVLLAFRAWVEGEISTGKLAELLETTVGMLEHTLSRYGLTLDADEYEAEVIPA